MKTFLAVLVLVGATMSIGGAGGCATPAYSAHERWQMIGRNWGFEWRQAQDDVDSALLLRPAGRLTIWHIQ